MKFGKALPLPRSSVDEVHKALLHRIRILQYPPGCRLHEATLAKEFGVSRTPIREALRRLHHLGLIETRNGVGTVVIQLSLRDLAQIYQMRIEICPLIARLSPNSITSDHLENARALHRRTKEASQSGGLNEYFLINEEINAIVQSIIGNSALRETWDYLHTQASSAWHWVELGEADRALTDELEDMITALEYADADAVGSVQRMHIGYGFLRLQRAMHDQAVVDGQKGSR